MAKNSEVRILECEQIASHMAEKSNPFSKNSATLYANSVQKNMVSAAKSKKIEYL